MPEEKPGKKGDDAKAEPEKKPPKKARKAKSPKKPHKADLAKKVEAEPVEPGEGKLTFDPSIVTEIAIREAQQITGIVQLTGSFMDDWVLRRGKGVSVAQIDEEGNEAYSLDLKISVEYGVDCVKLSTKVRDNIAKAIKKMTGRETRTINIHVTGLGHKEEPPSEHHEDEPVPEGTGIDF